MRRAVAAQGRADEAMGGEGEEEGEVRATTANQGPLAVGRAGCGWLAEAACRVQCCGAAKLHLSQSQAGFPVCVDVREGPSPTAAAASSGCESVLFFSFSLALSIFFGLAAPVTAGLQALQLASLAQQGAAPSRAESAQTHGWLMQTMQTARKSPLSLLELAWACSHRATLRRRAA